MEILASFFVSIMTVISGWFGHPVPHVQPMSQVVTTATTTVSAVEEAPSSQVGATTTIQSDNVLIWSDEISKYALTNESIYLNNVKIEGVDSKTFQIITQGPPPEEVNSELIAHYTKDKNHIYYDGKVIQGADILSYKVIWSGAIVSEQVFAKDINNIYYKGTPLTPQPDQVSFRPLTALSNGWRVGGDYSKDKNHVYYKNTEVKDVDISTFNSEYEDGYASDKNSVFLDGKVVPNANPKNFSFPVYEP